MDLNNVMSVGFIQILEQPRSSFGRSSPALLLAKPSFQVQPLKVTFGYKS